MTTSLRTEIRGYFNQIDPVGMMAVTLTLKKRVKGVWLDDIRASQNFRHFMNLLNSKVYGKRFKRFNKQLKVIPVMEMSASNRLHFHLIIEVPTDCDYLWLQNEVKEIWGKTTFGYREIDIQKISDDGWTDYITKFRTKGDEVDWNNVHLN